MSVPGWVYKKMAYGEISPEEVEQLEKMAMLLIVPAPKPLSELSDRQVKNRIVEQEMLRTPGTIGGAITGGLTGGLLGHPMGRGGALLGAAAGALGGGALFHAANVAGTNRLKKTLERRKEYDAMNKDAGIGDFVKTLKANPKSDELDAAFKMYEKETGKSKNTMSQKDILNYVQKHRTKTASVSPMGRAGANAAVADKSNNLHKVMKNVPSEDRDDVLRALRQMKKQAAHCAPSHKGSGVKKKIKSLKKEAAMTRDPRFSHFVPEYETVGRFSKKQKRNAAIAAGLATAAGGGLYLRNKKRKQQEKKAAAPLTNLQQAGILMGGAALAPVVSHLATKGIDRLMQKSPARIQQDLQRVLEVHPEIGRPEDPRVQMAYNSLVKLNPTYAEDPLIAGPLLKQIVESRMDPTNPMSNPVVDPGIAKNLSEARKSIREGNPRNTFGDAMGQGLAGGVQGAVMGGLAQPGGFLV